MNFVHSKDENRQWVWISTGLGASKNGLNLHTGNMVPLSTGITIYQFNSLPINMAGARTGALDPVTWFHSSTQKIKRPHVGTQILSQILKGGEGNRGQMPHICLWSPPLGLNIDRCIIDVSDGALL